MGTGVTHPKEKNDVSEMENTVGELQKHNRTTVVDLRIDAITQLTALTVPQQEREGEHAKWRREG